MDLLDFCSFACSQAPAWERYLGSSSFPCSKRQETGASKAWVPNLEVGNQQIPVKLAARL